MEPADHGMTLRLVLAGAAWMCATLFVPGVGASEAHLRALSFQPESVPFAKPFYRWVRETNRRCDLRIEVSGPEVVPSALQWHALMTGEVDLYYGPASYYRGALPQADVLSLAHEGPAAQRGNGAWELLNRLHNEELNAWYLTALADGVEFFIYTAKPATGGRLDGLRIRSVPLYDGFLESLGAQTRYLPAAAVRRALEQGSIDGYVWPLWSGGLGWERFVKFRYGPGFLNAATPILVNLDRWHAMTEPEQDCLTGMAKWVEGEWPRWREEEDARQLELLRAAGIEYDELGPDLGTKAEGILWKMLETAEPAFVETIKPRLAGGG